MNLIKTLISKNKFIVSCLLILSVVFFRWAVGAYDFSYFIVAGEDFVNYSETSIKVNEGPGYDGQFFYAYATNPCSNDEEISSVTIDFPAYRQQRIVYPTLAWIFSIGNAELVPFNMVFVNILALLLLVYLFTYFQKKNNQIEVLAFAPLLISALWMSLSRDLAENVEGLFIIATFYFLYNRKLLGYITCSTLAIFSREPSIVILLPASIMWAFYFLFNSNYKAKNLLTRLFYAASLSIPFLLFFCWKIYLYQIHNLDSFLTGESNIGIPFVGIYQGLKHNFLSAIDPISYIELGMWLALFVWNIFLLVVSSKSLVFNLEKNFFRTVLSASWLIALVFATTYSVSIYIDDWAFARVLSGFNLISFLLITVDFKVKVSRLFIISSIVLLFLTILRVVVRV